MKLVWIHFKYQINIKTLVFLGFFGLLLVFDLLYNAGIFASREERIIYYKQYFTQYHNDSSFNIYIILLIMAAFLPYLGENNYDQIYLSFCKRSYFESTRLIANSLFLFMICLFVFALYNFIPSLVLIYYRFELRIVRLFLDFFLQSVLIMLISSILKNALNNAFGGILTFIFFYLEKIIFDDFDKDNVSFMIKIFSYFCPIMIYNEGSYFFLYSEIMAVMAIIIYGLIDIFIYNKRNL